MLNDHRKFNENVEYYANSEIYYPRMTRNFFINAVNDITDRWK
jgi:hypothetical protein